MNKTPEQLLAKKKKIETKTIHVSFELPLYDQIEETAKDEGLYPGKFVRCAVDHYLKCKEY